MQKVQKQRARIILALVAALWGATVWGLTTGRFTGGDPATAQTCHTNTAIPIGQCPTPSRASGSATPSASGSPSRTPSSSPSSARPTPTPTPTPTPSPSQTTPPPPSVDREDSDISIAYRQGSFEGRVSSDRARCESGRKVTLKRVKKGKDAAAGRDRTNRKGKYGVRERNARGRYYAQVARKQYAGRNNKTIVCKAARSRTIRP